ncbi:zinc finger MYND domain-containing protein [Phanerochaete sordida]|uniref:Zinc finger MYND domain-containing protein n=1 Tax=Phanerochaete sordida TaxID=48140 RepID=A0A9P3G763_9APHY|nr:zinc finger MYND domain-containing protein [Phanerochaete sordida]
MSLTTPEAVQDSTRRLARELNAAQKAGLPIDGFAFGVVPTCLRCGDMIFTPAKPMKCSACKAIIYCSKACSRKDWTTPWGPGQPTHRDLCGDYKRHMERLPAFQAETVSFPWGRLELDGMFNFDIARARFDVLGGTGTGFWSHCGGVAPHRQRETRAVMHPRKKLPRGLDVLRQELAHVDGADLFLHDRHLSDEEGWKLAPEFVPFRDLARMPEARRPQMVASYARGVSDWDSWHEWRKLPKASPAALLMTYPLSVYHMLTGVLELTTPTSGLPNNRVSMCVHLLGVEVELNYLPIFAELALLLPYHDITLVLFGHGIKTLTDAAARAQTVPGSPLQRTLVNGSPIFEYAAPRALGSGTLTVLLHTANALWTHRGMQALQHTAPELYPDALLALDAGLGTYTAWQEVLHVAHGVRIPFAVTEYLEQSLEWAVRHTIPVVLGHDPARTHAIAPNPFHRPGQRALPCMRLPNFVNGFTLCVVPHDARRCSGCGPCLSGRARAKPAAEEPKRESIDDLD